MLESTYGDRLHGDRSQRVSRLRSLLQRCLADNGKIFIPAFSLGRTQEILYELDRIFTDAENENSFQSLNTSARPPVFIDSPLALKITEIYAGLKDFWDQEARELLRGGDHPLDFSKLFSVEKHYQHEQLLDVKGPAIIIAGSGMCTGGRIVDHLVQGIEDSRNDILCVGYMAKGTSGRAIQASARNGRRVVLDGVEKKVRAGVHVLSGYSAHADQAGLLDWVGAMDDGPGAIRLVHGESEARKVLGQKLVEQGYRVC